MLRAGGDPESFREPGEKELNGSLGRTRSLRQGICGEWAVPVQH